MEYEIKELNILDTEVNRKITELQRLTFGNSIADEKLKLNTYSSHGKSLYLGAFKEGTLAGFNAFIEHDFFYRDQPTEAYQSCWSATHPEHRGKGIFFTIITEAKRILKARNAAFIFGFPNANSYPIFTKKLGFYEIPLVKIQAPVLAFFLTKKILLKKLSKTYIHSVEHCFVPKETQVIELKKQEYGEAIKVYSSYNNSIWGKKRIKIKAGKSILYFSIGGLIVNKPHLLSLVFDEMIKAEKVIYVELIGAATNTYFDLFRNVKSAPLTEPLIVFDLNVKTSTDTNFTILTGIKDVF